MRFCTVHGKIWLAVLLLGAAVFAMPAISHGQDGELSEQPLADETPTDETPTVETPTDETRCDQLRARATAVHQERAGMNDTEDFLALAVGMETLDVALNEVAREYARLNCGRSSDDSAVDD